MKDLLSEDESSPYIYLGLLCAGWSRSPDNSHGFLQVLGSHEADLVYGWLFHLPIGEICC